MVSGKDMDAKLSSVSTSVKVFLIMGVSSDFINGVPTLEFLHVVAVLVVPSLAEEGLPEIPRKTEGGEGVVTHSLLLRKDA